MIFSSAIPCYAASGINPAEMQVLKLLQKGTKYNKDFYQYHNALKIYFNRDTVSISQIKADAACNYLVNMYDLYSAETMDEGKFFDYFQYVLVYVDVRIIYNRADSTADLIGGDGYLVMSSLKLKNVGGKRTISLNPIKTTGTSLWQEPMLYVGAAAAVLIAVGIVVIFKKRKETLNHNGCE
ncbi:MAG: hypothetical protein IKE65_07130 [Clostridia bacterium]|nr:hypothetical protein [Clostridia bacterium]